MASLMPRLRASASSVSQRVAVAPSVVRVSRLRVVTVQAAKLAKRAPSAYNLFVKSSFGQFKQQLVSSGVAAPTLGQISNKCSDSWAKLSEAAKTPFVRDAAAAKQQLAEAWANAPPGENDPPKKKKAAAGPRAQPPWTQYVQEQFPKIKAQQPNLKFVEVGKIISTQWKALTPAAKVPYERKYAADKAAIADGTYVAPQKPQAAKAAPAAKAPAPPARSTSPAIKAATPAAPAPRSTSPRRGTPTRG
mmetsp:Transcript_7109/g.12213  ORF Transcript_7109/g.12213 Transcript_7109/m.12213 type:complete len:248 (+) Transcript_7109:62-805(+)